MTKPNQPHSGDKDPTADEKPEKQVNIIVNGRQRSVSGREVTFEQIVALAFESPPSDPNSCFTVTYRRGQGEKPEGTLIEGGTVKIKEGMVFNVSATDKS